MPKKLPELPRATVWMDERGRITIPEYMRNASDLEEGSWVEIEAYPSLEECKSLLIRKA